MRKARTREENRWERAVSEHRAALDSFVDFVSALADDDWGWRQAEGKWTTAEVTEHLSLGYEAGIREVESGVEMAPRLSHRRQSVLRWFLLPHMLFHRSMPRARAPREIRPQGVSESAADGLTRLRQGALRFERTFSERPAARLTHPYFGSIDRVQTLRLAALHLEHHQRLLSAVLTRTR